MTRKWERREQKRSEAAQLAEERWRAQQAFEVLPWYEQVEQCSNFEELKDVVYRYMRENEK